MQEGIVQIGAAAIDEGDMLTSLIQGLSPQKKGKQLHVLKFNFRRTNAKQHAQYTNDSKEEYDNNQYELIIDTSEEMDENTSKKYLFLGKSGGPNSPQWYSSSTSSNYILTETIHNLLSIDLGEKLNLKIKDIFETLFVDLGDGIKDKYRFCIDLYKAGITDTNMQDIYRSLKDEGADDKKIIEHMKKRLEEYIKVKFEIKPTEIGLYTLLIDDIPISEYEEYRNAVLMSKSVDKDEPEGADENVDCKSDKAEKNDRTVNPICSICGADKNLTADMKDLTIKYYTTNQIIFGSGVSSKNYDRNMLLCSDCLKKLMVGETYIKNNLSTSLSGFTIYLIPHFIFGSPLNKEDLDLVSNKIKKSFNTVKTFNSIMNFDEALAEVSEDMSLSNDEDSYYLINIVFYKSAQQSTKIQKLIKDVNPLRFTKILAASNEVYRMARNIISASWKSKIDLQSIYYTVPIRVKDGKALQYKELISTYEAIFLGTSINRQSFISKILECVNIIYYSKKSYNINPDTEKMYLMILKGVLLLKFLEKLGCIEEVSSMDTSALNVKDDVKQYIQNVGYNEQQTAMFLLGCLIGEVGNAQYKRMPKTKNETAVETKKPILNKLNYSGMDKGRIVRLSNEIINKLRQEKILNAGNEIIYNEYRKLFDANISAWKLNKSENLFYILSGYAYSTTRPIYISKENGGNNNEQ